MRVRRLAMLLSGLAPNPSDSVELEQYATEGDLAARWLVDIVAFGDLTEGCTVADLGAGNGVLGLGSLEMGSGRVILVEADQAACDVAKSNAESMGFADSVEVICATLGSDQIDLGPVGHARVADEDRFDQRRAGARHPIHEDGALVPKARWLELGQ